MRNPHTATRVAPTCHYWRRPCTTINEQINLTKQGAEGNVLMCFPPSEIPLLCCCSVFATPWTAARQAPLSLGEEELKSLLMRVKEENETAGLKLNIHKTKIMASGPITSWQIDGEKMETVSVFFFSLGSKITGQCLRSWGSQRVRHELVTEQQL